MSDGRLSTTFAIAAAGAIGCVAYPVLPGLSAYLLVLALMVSGVASIRFATEPEALERWVALPRSRWKALALAPFFSGGGRGALHLLLNLGLALALQLGTRAAWDWSEPLWGDDDPVQLAIICAYGAFWVLLPSGLFALLWPDGSQRRAARLAIVAVPVGFTFWSLATPKPAGADIFHFYDLLHFVIWDGRVGTTAQGAIALLAALTALSILLNVPRMVRGLREVSSAWQCWANRAKPALLGDSGT